MSQLPPDVEAPFDPVAAQMVARVRRLMLISGVTTMVAIAAVIGVIGYRVFKAEGSVVGDVTATLPKGARIVSVAAGEDRIVVTVDLAGALELRIYDLKTLRQTGRLRFASEP
jgi:hypothetical protein